MRRRRHVKRHRKITKTMRRTAWKKSGGSKTKYRKLLGSGRKTASTSKRRKSHVKRRRSRRIY